MFFTEDNKGRKLKKIWLNIDLLQDSLSKIYKNDKIILSRSGKALWSDQQRL